jgi:hypothetical protein
MVASARAAAGAAMAAAIARLMSFLFIVFSAVVDLVKNLRRPNVVASCGKNNSPPHHMTQQFF